MGERKDFTKYGKKKFKADSMSISGMEPISCEDASYEKPPIKCGTTNPATDIGIGINWAKYRPKNFWSGFWLGALIGMMTQWGVSIYFFNRFLEDILKIMRAR